MDSLHKPVMVKEVLYYLITKKDGLYLDCTLGSGGHSRALLTQQPQSKIIAWDQDWAAITRCQQNSFFASQPITFVNDNFVNFSHYLTEFNIKGAEGFL